MVITGQNKEDVKNSSIKPNLWVIEDVPGGEVMVFKEFQKIFGSTLNIFWNYPYNKSGDKTKGNFFLKFLLYVCDNLNLGFFKKIYMVFYKYFLIRLLDLKNNLSLVSSSYIPLPKGKIIVAYIHTTPRFLNIGKDDFILEHNINSRIKRLIFLIFRKLFELNYVASLHNARVLFCNSNTVKDRLLSFYNIYAHVLYFPINSSSYFPKKFGNFFLCCSRINSTKRQELILSAFELFYQDNKEYNLHFVSPNPSKKSELYYLDKLKHYSKDKNLPVFFVNGLSDSEVIDQYSNCYATLFAGKNEDLGRVILESLASGKPVISVNEGGPKEIIEDGLTGFLVNSELEMALKMKFLARNPDVAKEMGISGKKYVEKYFSEKEFINKFNEILAVHLGQQYSERKE